ncbi:MAG TPA: DUF6600 domain-containing protein [Gemmatimonadales bacterium]|nr:DUF6600 domain-containing protein [Gemmatimonadales bacterium]
MATRKLAWFCCWLLCLAPPFAAHAQTTESGDPPGRAARLSLVDGRVSFQAAGDTVWGDARRNYTMTSGDRLYTDSDARAELEVGSLAVRLAGNTDLTVTNLTDQFAQLGLSAGTARISVYELNGGDTLEVDTPNGAFVVVEPGEYRFDVSPEDSTTRIAVDRGRVSMGRTGDNGAPQGVGNGQAVELQGSDPIHLTWITKPPADEFDTWSSARDARVTQSPSTRYVGRDIPGYEDLDDAGRWEVTAAYGPVWYPHAVAADWVPYRYGRWMWVEPWGWTWVEEEPWGFAPFHYGRWVLVSNAWGWVPGPVVPRHCYGPAFVVFMDGAGFTATVGGPVEGWFPLGPGEPFIPWYHYGDRYLNYVNVTNFRGHFDVSVVSGYANLRFVNRRAATVVSAEVLRSGEPIRGRVLPMSQTLIERVSIAPHPRVLPTETAVFGVRRWAPPPPAVRRPPMIMRSAPPRVVVSHAPAARVPPVRVEAHPVPSRPIITRRAPPAQNVPFSHRVPAMQQHPGRPLEPQQQENLRRGRAAGPPRDRERVPDPKAQRH